jgi:hypothetical protein
MGRGGKSIQRRASLWGSPLNRLFFRARHEQIKQSMTAQNVVTKRASKNVIPSALVECINECYGWLLAFADPIMDYVNQRLFEFPQDVVDHTIEAESL